MSDIGRYIKCLLVSMFAYLLSYGISAGKLETEIEPPPDLGFGALGWFFTTLMKLIYTAFMVMTFPGVPSPLNVLLSLVFGGLFIYGVVGLVYHLIKLVGGTIGGLIKI